MFLSIGDKPLAPMLGKGSLAFDDEDSISDEEVLEVVAASKKKKPIQGVKNKVSIILSGSFHFGLYDFPYFLSANPALPFYQLAFCGRLLRMTTLYPREKLAATMRRMLRWWLLVVTIRKVKTR